MNYTLFNLKSAAYVEKNLLKAGLDLSFFQVQALGLNGAAVCRCFHCTRTTCATITSFLFVTGQNAAKHSICSRVLKQAPEIWLHPKRKGISPISLLHLQRFVGWWAGLLGQSCPTGAEGSKEFVFFRLASLNNSAPLSLEKHVEARGRGTIGR